MFLISFLLLNALIFLDDETINIKKIASLFSKKAFNFSERLIKKSLAFLKASNLVSLWPKIFKFVASLAFARAKARDATNLARPFFFEESYFAAKSWAKNKTESKISKSQKNLNLSTLKHVLVDKFEFF